MRLVFCGTPQFAVPTLEVLHQAGHDIALVVCQPDRPKGRGMELAAPPVKQRALALGLPITQPERIKNNAELRAKLEDIKPDAIVVVAYGRIIPKWMLELPRFGNLNLHASLLPKYRGAAPIQWAIASGETVTGNTIIRLEEGLDTGDMLLVREIAIDTDDTAVTLAPKLAQSGSQLMLQALAGLEAGTITGVPQDHSKATLAPILNKEDGLISFERTAKEIHDRFRGFQPWPGAFTTFRGKRLTVHACHLTNEPGIEAEPGTMIIEHNGDLSVVCYDGTLLILDEVQVEGKKRVRAAEFMNGYQLKSGEMLGR
ncbi:MAG TPA: methionyl-tRNA formyltransferase [Terriglobales bacterium]|jgi:methionyl-tRNA formyltransferase